MRIKSIYISNYKNLQDFSLKLESDNFIDIFIGKNGSGKSNFIEALLEIFKHLFEEDYPITYSYKLEYEVSEEDIFIHWDWENDKWCDQEGNETTKVSFEKLPRNILVYYSGHNQKVTSLLNSYEAKHKANINSKRGNQNFLETITRRFSNIGANYKSILLAVILLQNDENKAKNFLKEKLNIQDCGDEIRLDFERPIYAKGKDEFTFDEFDSDKRFWSPQGYFKELLDQIWNVSRKTTTEVRDEGKQGEDEYILYRSFSSFQSAFAEYSPLDLFIAFDNLKTIGYLNEIHINLTLNNGSSIKIEQFSDGQFQAVYIYVLTELFKNRNCITLMDEPDSFLHPEWQYQFLDQIKEISEESSLTNHVLLNSHSAVTLIPYLSERVSFFDLRSNGDVNNYLLPKRIAIEKLSNNLIKYTEQEQILSIINTIQIENKPILFTEGKTDPLIIKEAWNKLNPQVEIPFIPFYAFGHKFVKQVMQDPQVITEMEGLPIFGLFDFDKAFNTWNGFSNTNLETDIHRGLVKKMDGAEENTNEEVFALMLPVPSGLEITSQVINETDGSHWGERSLMAIEHLFMHIPNLNEYFEIDESRPEKFKKFCGNKVEFAKSVVPNLDREHFEVFRPLFEFIESKIPVIES